MAAITTKATSLKKSPNIPSTKKKKAKATQVVVIAESMGGSTSNEEVEKAIIRQKKALNYDNL